MCFILHVCFGRILHVYFGQRTIHICHLVKTRPRDHVYVLRVCNLTKEALELCTEVQDNYKMIKYYWLLSHWLQFKFNVMCM